MADGYSAVRGTVRSAVLLTEQPAFITRERLTGSRAQGVRYERKALDKLEKIVEERTDWRFLRSPWLEFVDDSGRRWCQPDGVLFHTTSGSGLVVEIKYRHTANAWFQLWRLYVPVLERLYPGTAFSCCEWVKWFDPAASFPEAYLLTDDPLRLPREKLTTIHIWNPSRD